MLQEFNFDTIGSVSPFLSARLDALFSLKYTKDEERLLDGYADLVIFLLGRH